MPKSKQTAKRRAKLKKSPRPKKGRPDHAGSLMGRVIVEHRFWAKIRAGVLMRQKEGGKAAVEKAIKKMKDNKDGS